MFSSKKILLPLLTISLLCLLFIPFSQGEIKPYYTGDAVEANGRIYVATTNSGYIEIFTLDGGRLTKRNTIESLDLRYKDFYDLALTNEYGLPYLYAVNGRYLTKYAIEDPEHPRLVKREKDNSHDWFIGIGKFDGKVYTQGANGTKVWTYDLQVSADYKVINELRDNISFSKSGGYLFNIDNGYIEVVDSFNRYVISEIPIRTEEDHNRKIYVDESRARIYIVDDREVSEYNFEGRLLNSFEHISHLGYDTDGVNSKNHFYFSDGYGVVKLNKNNLEPLDWIFTTNLGKNVGWAMGMSVIETAGREVVIVFNNDGILALSDNLDVIDYYDAREVYGKPVEELYLNVTRNRALPGSLIGFSGGGFGSEEELEIKFLGDRFYIHADSDGRFSMHIEIPQVKPQRSDIKVTGLTSELTYSVAFQVE